MRKIKRGLAVISAVATLAVSAVPVSAMEYDMNTPQYKVLTQAMTSDFPDAGIYLDFLNKGVDKDAEYDENGKPVMIAHNVYVGRAENYNGYGFEGDQAISSIWVEYGPTEKYESEHGKSRYLMDKNIYWNWYTCRDKSYTSREIDDIIEKNSLEVSLESIDDINYNFLYPDNVTLESVLKTYYVLNDELNMNVVFSTADSMIRFIPEATLKGDANLDDIVDLADLTAVAKYNLNNEAYPLANETAYANADMNGDGVVDGLDTSALIENQLGK